MNVKILKGVVKAGDIIVSRTDLKLKDPLSLLSAAIRMFARTEYNHAALVVKDWDETFINEAIGYGIAHHEIGSRMKGKRFMVLRSKEPIDDLRTLMVKANSIVGKSKYDFGGLIHQAVYLTTGKWIGKRNLKAKKRMYCFEYVAWVYNKYFPLWYRVTPGEVINSRHFDIIMEGKLD